jgi:hypothetical protein
MTDTKNQKSLLLPISRSARQIARQFANLFDYPSAARQVYLDSLAVLVVNDYLQMMGIETDLKRSESWNPVLRLAADVSDLYLVGIGHLECRAIAAQQISCPIPYEVRENRLGYALVEIDETQQQGTILGFSQTVTTTELTIAQLRSLEVLLSYLQNLRQPKSVQTIELNERESPIVFKQWLKQIFEDGWQSLENLLASSPNLTLNLQGAAFRSSTTAIVKGAKLIDLGIDLGEREIVLLVVLTPEANEQVGILVQVHPAKGQRYLPAQLQLTVLAETGEVLKEVSSRSLDNYMQLPYFQGVAGESFQIQITLDRFYLTEKFLI